MKFLAGLFSFLVGAAVLTFFLRPWEGNGWLKREAERPQEAASAAQPPPVALPQQAPAQAKSQSPDAPESEPKRTLLAREQAEAERQAALKDDTNHAITPELPTKRYFKVKVRDAGTLEIDVPNADSLVIRLDGIEARKADEDCTREDGTVWPCGAKAKAALTLFIRSRAMTCTLPPGGEANEFSAKCSVMNRDLATWLVRRGWATPKNDAGPGLSEALQAAQSERIGLWEDE